MYVFGLLIVVAVLFSTGVVQVAVPGPYDFLPPDRKIQQERDMRQDARDRTDALTAVPKLARSETSEIAMTSFIIMSDKKCDLVAQDREKAYCHNTAPDEDILTPQYIAELCKVEGYMFHHKNFTEWSEITTQ